MVPCASAVRGAQPLTGAREPGATTAKLGAQIDPRTRRRRFISPAVGPLAPRSSSRPSPPTRSLSPLRRVPHTSRTIGSTRPGASHVPRPSALDSCTAFDGRHFTSRTAVVHVLEGARSKPVQLSAGLVGHRAATLDASACISIICSSAVDDSLPRTAPARRCTATRPRPSRCPRCSSGCCECRAAWSRRPSPGTARERRRRTTRPSRVAIGRRLEMASCSTNSRDHLFGDHVIAAACALPSSQPICVARRFATSAACFATASASKRFAIFARLIICRAWK